MSVFRSERIPQELVDSGQQQDYEYRLASDNARKLSYHLNNAMAGRVASIQMMLFDSMNSRHSGMPRWGSSPTRGSPLVNIETT